MVQNDDKIWVTYTKPGKFLISVGGINFLAPLGTSHDSRWFTTCQTHPRSIEAVLPLVRFTNTQKASRNKLCRLEYSECGYHRTH